MMEKVLNKKSLAYGVPGLIIQVIGFLVHPLILFLGTVFLIIGLGYYAKAKGHSGFFGLFGLLSWIGIIVLICLKDHNITPEEVEARKTTKPTNVFIGIVLGLGLVIGVPLLIFILFKIFVK
ncbi:MAG: hypothetical protein KBA46_04725 [Candidatus Omnitrophica bacterium]|nr:hypothetical protein [Candidatus Omnitrophota bacterium]